MADVVCELHSEEDNTWNAAMNIYLQTKITN